MSTKTVSVICFLRYWKLLSCNVKTLRENVPSTSFSKRVLSHLQESTF